MTADQVRQVRDSIIADYQAGMLPSEIAKKYGRSVAGVHYLVKARGIERVHRKPKPSILPGQRFTRLVTLRVLEKAEKPPKMLGDGWLCRCDCGVEKVVRACDLKGGGTKSCGCLRLEVNRTKNPKFRIDLTGQRFGMLTVLRFEDSSKHASHWLCRCDCGVEKVAAGKSLRDGTTKTCAAPYHHYGWKGGRQRSHGGYVRVQATGHPNADRRGYVLEHRLVMAESLGRALKASETVHHKNGIRDDNRLENLELWDGHHSNGQRVADKVAEAVKYLREHAPHLLASERGAP